MDAVGIRVNSASNVTIEGNDIKNLVTRSDALDATYLYGISASGAGSHTVTKNTVLKLINSTKPDANYATVVIGISISATGAQTVSGNTIYNIGNTNTTASSGTQKLYYVYGMVRSGTGAGTIVNGNKIYNLYSSSNGAGSKADIILGLFSQSNAKWTYTNNMISLRGGSFSADRFIVGITDYNTSSNNSYYYNSVAITGNAAGTNPTIAFWRNSTANIVLRNNIFYNSRSGGNWLHYAIDNTPTTNSGTGWSSNYNLFVGTNASVIGWWGNDSLKSFSEWKTISQGDTNSYSNTAANIPVTDLFIDHLNGDLRINTNNSLCWYANRKGIPIAGITTDIDNNTRNASTANGPTDIGAFEFKTNSAPISYVQSGTLAPENSTSYRFGGNTNLTIAWDAASVQTPSNLDVKYYTRRQVTHTKPRIYGYWNIVPNGGNNYIYNITFKYDESQLGNINENNLVPCKSDNNGNSWTAFTT